MATALKAAQGSPRPRAATTIMPAIGSPSQLARKKSSSSRSQRSPVLHQSDPIPESLSVDIMSTVQGPLRHPQPMSPSDLHLALEKEQEAMVSFKMNHLRLLSFPSVYSHPLSFSLPLGKSTDSRAVCSAPADSVSRINCLLLFNHERSIRHIPNLPLARQLRPLSHTSRRQRSCSSLSAHTAAQSSQSGSITGIAPSRESSMSHSRVMRSREPSLTSRRPSIGSITSYPSQAIVTRRPIQASHLCTVIAAQARKHSWWMLPHTNQSSNMSSGGTSSYAGGFGSWRM
ncbi:hypothetical protein POX_f07898 [Penicillium oxalicum]|uniref:hypothetical protein n=1 Tax=Penicillium oxalicum TaxID=69781 RepID=UPI0020B7B16B|nr:hypothetical protein POX_f07898 [Penicillium oxalicum]KAI2787529.1 hypothetical protein POX_f07898 [Penicillium oxalicum]